MGEFSRHKMCQDGIRPYCRACARAYQKAHGQSEAGKVCNKRAMDNYIQRHPERIKAREAVSNAIRYGKMIKPTDCSHCEQPNDKIEAHHPDYSKPLEVVWLCRSCHHNEHKDFETRRKENGA